MEEYFPKIKFYLNKSILKYFLTRPTILVSSTMNFLPTGWASCTLAKLSTIRENSIWEFRMVQGLKWWKAKNFKENLRTGRSFKALKQQRKGHIVEILKITKKMDEDY